MNVQDIVKRVQAKCDDPDGTYITPDYVMVFMQDEYERIANKLRTIDDSFDEQVVELPAVAPGTTDLNAYQAAGKALDGLVTPRRVEWKLAGQLPIYYRDAEGPLDKVRDVIAAPVLDSWGFRQGIVQVGAFSVALDLRVTGDFLFVALNDPSSTIKIANTVYRAFSCYLAAAVGKARGNQTWKQDYTADGDDALDDLTIMLVKQSQGKTRRVARMSRRYAGSGQSTLR